MSPKRILFSLVFAFLVLPFVSCAQENSIAPETLDFEKAVVLDVSNEHMTDNFGTSAPQPVQTLRVKIIDGPNKGKIVTFENDYTQLSVNDVFYTRHQVSPLDSIDVWRVSDPYRLNVLGWLTVVFVALIFLFGGIQGVRGLASLIGSFVLIFYLLIPGIYAGYSAPLISIGVASLIIIVGSYITHGFNKTTTAAVLGMIGTVIITGLGTYYIVHVANLSGFSSEEIVYLNFDTNGRIDMVGLLFGGIMIGLLGVLYDIAISQAIIVEELFRAGTHLTRLEVYRRALRVGKEHIGALVDTLAIAYVGAALPLLLLLQSSTTGTLYILNSEIFATEIIRILIGSIGLILAVPITTLIASRMLHGNVSPTTSHETHHH
jgi:uncharacterized membrane protein